MELQPLQTQSQKSHTKKWARKLLKTCTKNWCGEGDLNSRTTLKTRKLYTTRSSQNTRSARSTPPSHTTSHTAWSSALQYIAAAPESRSAHQPAEGSQITRPRSRATRAGDRAHSSGWQRCGKVVGTRVCKL